jgi:hypothetical protein
MKSSVAQPERKGRGAATQGMKSATGPAEKAMPGEAAKKRTRPGRTSWCCSPASSWRPDAPPRRRYASWDAITIGLTLSQRGLVYSEPAELGRVTKFRSVQWRNGMDTYHEGQEVMVATPAGKSQWSKATIVRVMQGPDFDQDWFVFVVEFPGRSRGAFSADHVRPANAEGCRALCL